MPEEVKHLSRIQETKTRDQMESVQMKPLALFSTKLTFLSPKPVGLISECHPSLQGIVFATLVVFIFWFLDLVSC